MRTAHIIGTFMHARGVRGTSYHRTDLRNVNDIVLSAIRVASREGASYADDPDTGEMRQLAGQQKVHEHRGCAR